MMEDRLNELKNKKQGKWLTYQKSWPPLAERLNFPSIYYLEV